MLLFLMKKNKMTTQEQRAEINKPCGVAGNHGQV